jgi:hypothetical protein
VPYSRLSHHCGLKDDITEAASRLKFEQRIGRTMDTTIINKYTFVMKECVLVDAINLLWIARCMIYGGEDIITIHDDASRVPSMGYIAVVPVSEEHHTCRPR